MIKLDTAKYIALSYVGRDQQVDSELLEVVIEHNADNLTPGVTRTRFKKIGRNLVAAVHQLRASKKEIVIWIDAICI
jgi:Heterokaryon incompatibility protein (HET)